MKHLLPPPAQASWFWNNMKIPMRFIIPSEPVGGSQHNHNNNTPMLGLQYISLEMLFQYAK